MNIVLYTAYGIFSLQVAAFLTGALSALIMLFLQKIPAFKIIVARDRFPRFHEFSNKIKKIGCQGYFQIFTDCLLCVSIAILLITLTFIYNSGSFRIMTVISMLSGFLVAKRIFYRSVFFCLEIVLYLLKWIYDIFSFPIFRLCAWIKKLVLSVFGEIRKKYVESIISGYSEKQFKNVGEIAKFGFLDEYYKEHFK